MSFNGLSKAGLTIDRSADLDRQI